MIPENFKNHYRKILGEKKAEVFFSFCVKPLKKCVRINPLKYSIEKFLNFSKEKKWKISPISWCKTGYYIERKREERENPIGNTAEHLLGGIYIQEASSMLPVTALFSGHENIDFSRKIVCDIASAPGSKTTQLSAEMNGKGCLVANEISSSRVKALFSNIERCGVKNVILTNYDGKNLCHLLPKTFDFLLLDAPCTGEGTIRKNPKALNNWRKTDAIRMGNLQKKLITSAFSSLKNGGEMVYSTCTLAQEENEDVIEFLQKEFPDEVKIISLENCFPDAKKALTQEGFLRIWPEIFDSEGFFIAKIKREIKKNSQQNIYKVKIPESFPFEKISHNEEKQVIQFFYNQWGYTINIKKNQLWKKENIIWMFPQRAEEIFSRIKCDRIGIPLVTIHKKEWRTRYECCSAFGKNFKKNILTISKKQFEKIYAGEDLYFSSYNNVIKEEFLCTYKNFPVAIGKMIKGKWKNALPRVLIRKKANG